MDFSLLWRAGFMADALNLFPLPPFQLTTATVRPTGRGASLIFSPIHTMLARVLVRVRLTCIVLVRTVSGRLDFVGKRVGNTLDGLLMVLRVRNMTAL